MAAGRSHRLRAFDAGVRPESLVRRIRPGARFGPRGPSLDPTDVINNPNKYDPNGDQNNGYLQLLENFGQQYTQNVNPRPDLVSGVNVDQRGVTPCCFAIRRKVSPRLTV